MILPAKIRRERVKLGFKFHCSFFPGEVVSDRFSGAVTAPGRGADPDADGDHAADDPCREAVLDV